MIIRSLFVVSILVWVVVLDELLPIFLFVAFAMCILFFQGFKLNYMLKSLRLLMWLFIPILIFHGLFTSGRMIQEPMYIPLSIEGLERGVYLSAHIALIFFCALLFFRVFSQLEWLSFVDRLPNHQRLKTYIVLLMSLKNKVSCLLQEMKNLWSEQGKPWRKVPQLMVELVQDVLLAAQHEAKVLWLDWDTHMREQDKMVMSLWSNKELMYLGILLAGWGLFCLL